MPSRGELTVVSWHTPNAASDGRAVKMAAYSAMGEWLQQAPRPLVVGADLNTWVCPVDLLVADPDDGFYEEHAFVGPDPAHGLADAYRTVFEGDGRLDWLRAEGALGPLAISHVLESGAEHRMERIFASRNLTPVDGGYDYAGAAASGSDHALHWIDFS